MSDSKGPITQFLCAAARGDADARERFWQLVYDELYRLASAQLANDGLRRHMQPTSLVHEAYRRLAGDKTLSFESRRHFFAAAAEAMRRIRVDDARKRKREKRGGGRQQVPLADDPPERRGAGGGTEAGAVRGGGSFSHWEADPAELLAVNEALEKLRAVDPLKAELVGLRYFAGLSVDETAAVMGVSPRTVDNEWRFARAWLRRELGDEVD